METFKLKTVEKNWGYEIWMSNNLKENYCSKILFIEDGKSTSMHYHLSKHETFYVMKGTLVVDYLLDKEQDDIVSTAICQEGESMEVERGRVHQLIARGGDVTLIESSTFHRDSDSYRMWVQEEDVL